MLFLARIIISSIILCHLQLKTICQAYTLDPCTFLKCPESEISCLQLIAESATYQCRCVKFCKQPNFIKSPIVRTLPPKTLNKSYNNNNNNNDDDINKTNINETKVTSVLSSTKDKKLMIPLAKQGGSACYNNPCMNGGTCYTNSVLAGSKKNFPYDQPICVINFDIFRF
jgi:hypothetical protein